MNAAGALTFAQRFANQICALLQCDFKDLRPVRVPSVRDGESRAFLSRSPVYDRGPGIG